MKLPFVIILPFGYVGIPTLTRYFDDDNFNRQLNKMMEEMPDEIYANEEIVEDFLKWVSDLFGVTPIDFVYHDCPTKDGNNERGYIFRYATPQNKVITRILP